jgi:predicted TIM-barrel fold metal-dependent hydrolase
MTQPERVGAIDAWMSIMSPETADRWPDPFWHIFRKYGVEERFRKGFTLDQILDEMDEAGVDIGIASSFKFLDTWVVDNDETAAYIARAPDRFVGCFTVDIRDPMPAMREFRRCVEELGYRAFRLEPYQYGDGRTTAPPPTDRMYWPFYVACCEYDIPVAIQVGHTGPLLPSECGRPIYLDEVALTFPELKILGTHVGNPWEEEMMILAWKHPNVYVESSARPARQWPEGLKKLLPFQRTVQDVYDCGFSDEATRKILRDNAARVFKIDV